jgi:hypothetical protein
LPCSTKRKGEESDDIEENSLSGRCKKNMVRRCEDLDILMYSFLFFISQLVKQNEKNCVYKSFSQLLYLASIDRQGNKCGAHQEDNLLLSINVPDLSKINRF